MLLNIEKQYLIILIGRKFILDRAKFWKKNEVS